MFWRLHSLQIIIGEEHSKLRRSCLCHTFCAFLPSFVRPLPAGSGAEKLIILCQTAQVSLTLFFFFKYWTTLKLVKHSACIMVRFPEATNCRGSAPVLFYIRLLVAYQLPLGPWPLFGVKDTTAVAFTGFSNPRSSERN